MRRTVASLALLFALAFSASAAASDVIVLHGIKGTDLDPSLPVGLPVDIAIPEVQACLTHVEFGNVLGPLALSPGSYGVEVRLSDGKCTGALAITGTFDLALFESATVVAHLTEEGAPTLTKFVNDLRGTDKTRVVARHGAAAPPVNVILTEGRRRVSLRELENGGQRAAEVDPGSWSAKVRLVGSPATIDLGDFDLMSSTAYFIHAVGSLSNGSFEILVIPVPLP